jgi:hypothetical protein
MNKPIDTWRGGRSDKEPKVSRLQHVGVAFGIANGRNPAFGNSQQSYCLFHPRGFCMSPNVPNLPVFQKVCTQKPLYAHSPCAPFNGKAPRDGGDADFNLPSNGRS